MFISVDLGGTNLRVGAVTEAGEVVRVERLPSESTDKSARTLERIGEAVQAMAGELRHAGKKVAGIALGVAGIVDKREGRVYHSPHFPDWKAVEVRSYFQKRFSVPVILDNDCHLIGLGEGWKGAAQGMKNFLLIALGTGVGGAIVWNGQILSGDSGFGGEIGHMAVVADGPPCACGSQGCFEMFVSSSGILYGVENVIERDRADRDRLLEKVGGMERLTVQKIYEAARDGDIFASSIFRRMGYYLGLGIASLVNITGIERVIVGGGVSEAWDFFIEPAKKELAERTFEETARRIEIRKASLGDQAGLIGGAHPTLWA